MGRRPTGFGVLTLELVMNTVRPLNLCIHEFISDLVENYFQSKEMWSIELEYKIPIDTRRNIESTLDTCSCINDL